MSLIILIYLRIYIPGSLLVRPIEEMFFEDFKTKIKEKGFLIEPPQLTS